jgi:hypothetical protein
MQPAVSMKLTHLCTECDSVLAVPKIRGSPPDGLRLIRCLHPIRSCSTPHPVMLQVLHRQQEVHGRNHPARVVQDDLAGAAVSRAAPAAPWYHIRIFHSW